MSPLTIFLSAILLSSPTTQLSILSELAQNATSMAASAAETVATGAAEKAKDVATGAAEKAKDVATEAAEKAKDVATEAAGKAKDVATGAAEKAKDVATEAAEKAKDVATGAAEKAKDVATEAAEKAKDVATGAAEKAKDVATEAAEKAKDVATGTSSLVTNEVAAVLQPVGEVAVAVIDSKCDIVKDFFQIQYKDYEGQEPDISKLTLEFKNDNVSYSYKLAEAAVLIPQSEWFNPELHIYIYLHGFTDSPDEEGYTTMRNSFFLQGDVNILGLDASSLIRFLYLRSSTMVQFIGKALGEVLADLVNDVGVDPSKIHLIGHSLGSHIGGFAGQTFKNLTSCRIGRISALDPAGPCFLAQNDTARLSADDADFVDVIHTNAKIFGIADPVGDVDIYPNGGDQQPDCLLPTCSHSMAWKMFAESVVNNTAFVGVRCDSWSEFKKEACDYNDTITMGYLCPGTARGTYFLQTEGDSPYGKGEDGLQFVDTEGLAEKIVSALT